MGAAELSKEHGDMRTFGRTPNGLLARLVGAAALVAAGIGVAAAVPQAAGASTLPPPPLCGNAANVAGPCPTSQPGISYTPSVINFGYIANNGGSSTQSVTFTNTSTQTLQIGGNGASVDGAGDEETGIECVGGYTVTLAPGQSCTANITLKIVNGVTDASCGPTINNACEQGWAPVFYVGASGSAGMNGFYVPITATIGPPQTTPPPPPATGPTGPGPQFGEQAAQGCVTMPAGSVVGMAATPNDGGYWIADSQGQVDACGNANTAYGELSSVPSSPVVGIALDAAGTGYWLVTADGTVYSFGSAGFHGDMAGHPLNSPIVGMAADPATGGYWLLGADGGVFSFDAPFFGSTGNIHLNKPVVGMAATKDGGGYWFVASDGGIFAFGDAAFHGSMGGKPLNKPVDGMAPDFATGGYWLVAADGGIFSFDAPFFGSTGNIRLAKPIVGMEAASSGAGYRFVASDGGIFSFGSSAFYGSAA
jgi:hypothetical protein